MSTARIREDIKQALKEKQQERADALRLVLAALLNEAKAKRVEELEEEDFLSVLSRLVKQRKESIEVYRQGKREDLAVKEEAELEIIQGYLPEQLSEDEVKRLAAEAVEKTGASSPREMGKVMAALMPSVKGKADGKLVSQVVKDLLSGE